MDSGNLALQYAFSGITIGCMYAVVAIGFSLIYRATGVLNFAQGEFVILGGMVAVTLKRFAPLSQHEPGLARQRLGVRQCSCRFQGASPTPKAAEHCCALYTSSATQAGQVPLGTPCL